MLRKMHMPVPRTLPRPIAAGVTYCAGGGKAPYGAGAAAP